MSTLPPEPGRAPAHPIPDASPRDYYAADPSFAVLAGRLLAPAVKDRATGLFQRLGTDAAVRLSELAVVADKNPPQLRAHDRRGELAERIEYHPAYRELVHAALADHGLVALAYPPESALLGATPHTVSLLLSYLFAQGECGVLCPICMTDAAARTLQRCDPDLAKEWVPRLASRDRDRYVTGAMFLTEREGGSDVGQIASVARDLGGRRFAITGRKWFCSNADAGFVLTLARLTGAPAGTRGLGLFALLPPEGERRPGFRVARLKDKLGVRSMASAEIDLDGTPAVLVGDPTRGFQHMTEMLNLCRLWNSVCAVGLARRGLAEAWPHVCARRAFGRALVDHVLLRESLADVAVHHHAARRLVFEGVRLLDTIDAGGAGIQAAMTRLRLLTPLVKYRTAKLAVWAASECIELFGGNGYIEDWPLARVLRDAQVLPIWEGASNIMVLDVLRAMRKENALAPVIAELRAILQGVHGALAREAETCSLALDTVITQAATLAGAPEEDALLAGARPLCDRLAAAWELALVLGDARDGTPGPGGAGADAVCARRLAARLAALPALGVGPVAATPPPATREDLALLLGPVHA